MSSTITEVDVNSECNDWAINENHSYYDETNNTDDNETMSFSSVTKQKKRTQQKDKESMGYYTIDVKTDQNKSKSVSFYATKSIPGTRIRNAINGIPESYKVGKKEEDLFFKVRMASGQFGKNPFGNDLYYMSPEQFERHFSIVLTETIKNKWYCKYNIAKNLENEKSKKEQSVNNKFTIVK